MTKEQCKASGGIYTTAGSCLGTASSIPGVRELVFQQPQKAVTEPIAAATERRLSREKWMPWLIMGGVGLGVFGLLRYKKIL